MEPAALQAILALVMPIGGLGTRSKGLVLRITTSFYQLKHKWVQIIRPRCGEMLYLITESEAMWLRPVAGVFLRKLYLLSLDGGRKYLGENGAGEWSTFTLC